MPCSNEKIDERFVVVIAAALLVLEVGSGAVSVILCVGYVEWTSLFSCRRCSAAVTLLFAVAGLVAVVSVRLLLVSIHCSSSNTRLRHPHSGTSPWLCPCLQGLE